MQTQDQLQARKWTLEPFGSCTTDNILVANTKISKYIFKKKKEKKEGALVQWVH